MNLKKIIFATGNEGKMREVRMILEDLGVEILSMKEAGIEADVEENGKTFEENADIWDMILPIMSKIKALSTGWRG